ncbi:MAG: hypothetical protein RSD49_17075, partial [Hafnia sp.]
IGASGRQHKPALILHSQGFGRNQVFVDALITSARVAGLTATLAGQTDSGTSGLAPRWPDASTS